MDEDDIPEPPFLPGPDETPVRDDALRNEAIALARRVAGRNGEVEIEIVAEILTHNPNSARSIGWTFAGPAVKRSIATYSGVGAISAFRRS